MKVIVTCSSGKDSVAAFPNELELTKDIDILLKKEIDSMIEEGSVKVVGITVNKLRILKLDKHN